MSRSENDRPEFSQNREFKVILEGLQSQFRVFGDGLQIVNNRLDRLEQHVERMDSFLQKVLPTIATKDDLKKFEGRLTTLENTR